MLEQRRDSNQPRKVYRKFPGLSKYAFQHPDDLKATINLKDMLPVKKFLQMLAESLLDKAIYTLKVSDSIMVTPRQAPKLWEIYVDVAETLDVKRLPTLFLSYSSNPPEVFGIDWAFISISPFFIDRMEEGELRFLLGKMLSWVKLEHLPYITAVSAITTFSQILLSSFFRIGRLLVKPIEMPLLAWKRVAEYSTDRGGLLACQDINSAQKAIVKLTGYSFRYMRNLDFEELERQVKESEHMDEDMVASFVKNYYQVRSAEPFSILRLRELKRFHDSEDYLKILRGEYLRVEEETAFEERVKASLRGKLREPVSPPQHLPKFCPSCGHPIDGNYRFCPNCGFDLSSIFR